MHQIVKVYQASNVVLYVNYYFNITILPISTVRVKNEENLHTGLKYFLRKVYLESIEHLYFILQI